MFEDEGSPEAQRRLSTEAMDYAMGKDLKDLETKAEHREESQIWVKIKEVAFSSENPESTRRGLLNLEWTEGDTFQNFIMAIIVANIFVLWGETDAAELWIWVYIDNTFLTIFLVELILRFIYRGLRESVFGKERLWNYLDFIIVVLGMIDLWIMPHVIQSEETSEHPQPHQSGVAMLRFLRMLRLLRLARVVKMIPKLRIFMEALAGMFAPVSFFLGLLFTVMLILSIILTQVFQNHEDPDIQHFFHSVVSSFFTLFQVCTTDNWIYVADPLINLDPRWQIFFVLFIAFSSWTMISILTAVACDNMISAMEDKTRREKEEAERKQKEFIVLLRAAFNDADDDGNGLLDLEEFEEFLDSEGLQKVFEVVDMHVTKDEMRKRFELLDVSGCGTLTTDEFVDGLATYQEGLSTKHIVNLDYAVRRLSAHFDIKMKMMEEKVATLKSRNLILVEGLRKQEQVYQQQHCAIFAWQQWALRTDPKAFPAEFLRQVNRKPPDSLQVQFDGRETPSPERSLWADEMPEDAI